MSVSNYFEPLLGESVAYPGQEAYSGQSYMGQKNHATIRSMITHGLSRSTTYSTWHGMEQRATNPNHKRYKDYGHLGIDPRWEKFGNFFEDMGEKPPGMTLDRIDNEKGYFKENCRWASPSDQMHHQKLRKSAVPFRGVSIVKRSRFKRYAAEIKYNYKKIVLGTFYTPEEAALAYDAAAIQLRGEFAETNIL